MPRFNVTASRTDSHLLGQLLARAFAFGVLLPALAWAASNFVATSPALTGLAFRDLSALGLFLFAGSGYFNLYRS